MTAKQLIEQFNGNGNSRLTKEEFLKILEVACRNGDKTCEKQTDETASKQLVTSPVFSLPEHPVEVETYWERSSIVAQQRRQMLICSPPFGSSSERTQPQLSPRSSLGRLSPPCSFARILYPASTPWNQLSIGTPTGRLPFLGGGTSLGKQFMPFRSPGTPVSTATPVSSPTPVSIATPLSPSPLEGQLSSAPSWFGSDFILSNNSTKTCTPLRYKYGDTPCHNTTDSVIKLRATPARPAVRAKPMPGTACHSYE